MGQRAEEKNRKNEQETRTARQTDQRLWPERVRPEENQGERSPQYVARVGGGEVPCDRRAQRREPIGPRRVGPMRKNARNLPGGDDHGHVDADLVVPIVEGNRAQRVQALDDDPKERPTDQGIVSTLRALSHSLDANQAHGTVGTNVVVMIGWPWPSCLSASIPIGGVGQLICAKEIQKEGKIVRLSHSSTCSRKSARTLFLSRRKPQRKSFCGRRK